MSSRNKILTFAAASVMLALTAGGPPACANESVDKPRPVGPHEPILASIGEKRLVASFAVGFDYCALELSVWNSVDAAPDTSVRGVIDLAPGEAFNIENPKNRKQFLALQCGDDAKTLLVKEAVAE